MEVKMHDQASKHEVQSYELYSGEEGDGSDHLAATNGKRKWWQDTIIYQIYPRSFQDSTGDGIGDLKGIQSRLDYFEFLNVSTLWLSPIYESPMKDFGYDVSDFRAIDPIFGSMEDFDNLIQEMHNRGMNLIMDFIPNHTSDQHKWFKESRQSRHNPFTDYYIWSDGIKTEDGSRRPPNNWLSVFGHSAWEFDESRGQFYYHQFLKEQPDLNFRNQAVRKEIENDLRFWLDKGVDGFRIDALAHMFEVEDLRLNEPRSFDKSATPDMHEYLEHPYTMNLPEIHDVMSSWRKMFEEYTDKTQRERFMVIEIYDRRPNKDMSMIMKYYAPNSMPFNFNFIELQENNCSGNTINSMVREWMDSMPPGHWPNWVFSNHDNSRISTRLGSQYVSAINMVLLLLPGTPTTYYGEELGMTDVEVSFEDTQDPFGKGFGKEHYKKFSRDPARCPMQWSCAPHSGFTKGSSSWLPVDRTYDECNVEAQKVDDLSPLNIYCRLSKLRMLESFKTGRTFLGHYNDDVFSFVRQMDGSSSYLVAVNVGKREDTSNYERGYRGKVTGMGKVLVATRSCERNCVNCCIDLSSVTLQPGDGLVIQLTASVD